MNNSEIKKAVLVLRAGGVVAYPTDTAYGLAVDATNPRAVVKLYLLKGRDFHKPIHVIFPTDKYYHTTKYSSIGINRIVKIDFLAEALMKKFFPGPLTIVVPLIARGKSWQMLSAGTKTMGVRLPNNKIALELVNKFGKPITTTSANVTYQTNCYSVSEIKQQFKNSVFKPDFYLDGGKLPKKEPSTVVSLIKGVKILRVGPINEKQIRKALS